MVNFCDALPYCEVHGHKPQRIRDYVIDIIGNIVEEDVCNTCGMTRRTMKQRNELRVSETTYPRGIWE